MTSKPKAPRQPKPVDQEKLRKEAEENERLRNKSRRGRSSTILSGLLKLGGDDNLKLGQ